MSVAFPPCQCNLLQDGTDPRSYQSSPVPRRRRLHWQGGKATLISEPGLRDYPGIAWKRIAHCWGAPDGNRLNNVGAGQRGVQSLPFSKSKRKFPIYTSSLTSPPATTGLQFSS